MVRNSLCANINAWQAIGANSVVLDWIKNGVEIPFTAQPAKFDIPNPVFSDSDVAFLDSKLAELEKDGVIRKCLPNEEPWCVSPIKVVNKTTGTGEKRLLVNLYRFNQYVVHKTFKTEGIDIVAELIQPNDVLQTVDIKDGFFHVKINSDFHKYLAIRWRGVVYFWCCLPQGLSCSPYFFHKVLRPVVQYLRENGLRVSLYVDDFISLAARSCATDHIDFLIHTLQDLGWRINFDKSDLSHTCTCTHLGFDIDSTGEPWIRVTRKRLRKLKKCIGQSLHTGMVSARSISRIAGQCISMMKAILPAKLLLQNMYHFISTCKLWDEKVCLPDKVKSELQWWFDSLITWNGAPFKIKSVDCQLETDSSGTGWGVWMGNHASDQAAGLWTGWVAHKSINYKELLAVGMALQSFGPRLEGKTVQILSDNITTVACINRFYSHSTELGELAQAVWVEAHKWNIVLRAKHLSGKNNYRADYLSRIHSPYEWKLNPRLFAQIDYQWGPHTVDRCASMLSAQLPVYNSLYHDPYTSGVDCLAQRDWRHQNNFVNPPMWMIPNILRVVKAQGAMATLVAPWWPAQPWFMELLNMSIDLPIPIQICRENMISMGVCPEPLKNPKWKLYAWRISGSSI